MPAFQPFLYRGISCAAFDYLLVPGLSKPGEDSEENESLIAKLLST
ncbi:MAG: hypothetical protein O3C21_04280 [Verrucomicrobia bacterium]|nr:hypothetical protein [Verrucomicrobiota bacterium]